MDKPLCPLANRIVGVLVGLWPRFCWFWFSVVCFAVSSGETQVWLGDLRVVVFVVFCGFCFVCFELPAQMDISCPCTNVFHTAYAHVRTEPLARHRPNSRKKKIKFWDSLSEVFFHNCCHGGQRKKGTRWKSTPGVFATLAATCADDHEHLPYQVQQTNGSWSFDTAAEAAYPELLTRRVATAVKNFLMQRNLIFRPPPNPRIKTLAVQHRQHKKRSQLIPEFSTTAWYPKTHKISNIQKLIPSSNSGEYQEGDQPQMTTEDILVGTWHTPEQFVNKAQHSPHPMEENALHKITKDATEFVAKSPVKLVSIERKKNLLKAKILARQLESQEKELHEGLPTSIQKVVQDKKILLWEKLLELNNYDDMKVVHFMKEGVPLVGTHDHPSCYAMKLKLLASTTEEELRDSAMPSRLALEARKPQTDSPSTWNPRLKRR